MKNLPHGWKVEKLENLANIKGGFTFKSQEFVDEGVQVIRISNIGLNELKLDDVVYYKESESLKKYLIQKYDILMSLTGDDKSIKICQNTSEAKLYLNQRVASISAKGCHQSFLLYSLRKNSNLLLANAVGAAQKNISFTDLKDLPISIPPLPQQEKIVSVLDTASALVEKQKALLEKYDLFLKSKFIEMFGDPVKNPMEWEIVKMKDIILDVKNGLSRRSDDESGQIVLKLKDIRTNFIRYINPNRIELDEKEKQKYSVDVGDLLFIRVNGNPDYVGRCAIFNGFKEEVYFNDHIMRVKVKEKLLNSLFLAYLLNLPYGKMQIHKYRKTSAGQHTISQDGLERVSIFLPSIELQYQFAKIVEQVETLREKEEQKLEKLQTLYDALMKRAFDGEIA